jgi:hypothetical protein
MTAYLADTSPPENFTCRPPIGVRAENQDAHCVAELADMATRVPARPAKLDLGHAAIESASLSLRAKDLKVGARPGPGHQLIARCARAIVAAQVAFP